MGFATNTFDTLYYRRQVTAEQLRQVLQCYAEGVSLRGIAGITGLAYNTVVSLVKVASHKAQQVHNLGVADVKTDAVSTDELWSFVKKSKNNVSLSSYVWVGDCWIVMFLDRHCGLILSARVNKHTDILLDELITSTER